MYDFESIVEHRPSVNCHIDFSLENKYCRLHYLLANNVWHHDNVSVHSAQLTTDFPHSTGINLMSHPHLTPELAPCNPLVAEAFNQFKEHATAVYKDYHFDDLSNRKLHSTIKNRTKDNWRIFKDKKKWAFFRT